jgi:hypothetical protein
VATTGRRLRGPGGGHRPPRPPPCRAAAARARAGRWLAALTGLAVLAGPAAAGCSAERSPGPAAAVSPKLASPKLAWSALCAAQPTPSLRAALDKTVARSRSGEVIPLGLSADGQTAYVSTWAPGFSGVAALNLASGGIRKIQSYANPGADQADGASGGRWLVWEETVSLENLDNFTVYAWDSATGRLHTIGHSLDGPGRVPWPSPWHPPAVSGDYAAWAQGYGPGGEVEIRLADLATGQVRVIRQGHTQPPFFDGNLVVWPESDRPGAQTTLHAFSLATDRPAALPVVLRGVHGTEFVVTDGVRTAYFSPDLTTLYYSPAPGRPGRAVLRLPANESFADLAIGPGTLAWTTTVATYLASTRIGSYVQVTPEYGDATGSGSGVLISDAATDKVAHPILPMHVISPASVTWPACPPGIRS